MNSWSKPDSSAQVDHRLGRVDAPLPGDVGHRRVGRQPLRVHAGCPRSRAAGPGRRRRVHRAVVGVDRPRRRTARVLAGRASARSCSAIGQGPKVVPRGQQVEGQPGLERQQHRDPPAVGLGDEPAAGAAPPSSRKSSRWPASRVATRPKVIGHLGLGGQLLHPPERTGPASLGVGGHHAAVGAFEDAGAESPMTADQLRRPRPTTPAATRPAGRRTSRGARCARSRTRWRRPGSTRSSWPFISARSSSSASSSNARSPMAHVRSAECPTLAAKLMPLGAASTASRYSGKVSKLQSMPCGQRGGVDVLGPLEVAHDQGPLARRRPARG